MQPGDDENYFRRREVEERQAARLSSCVVRDVHEEFAELYAARALDPESPFWPPPFGRKEL